MTAPLQLVVNGEPHAFTPAGAEPPSVAALVASLGLDPRQIAVERNREIVPRATYADTTLEDGDRFEIVTFVGGG